MTCLKCKSKNITQEFEGDLIALCLDCGYTLTEFQFGYDEMFSKEDFKIEICRCGEVKLKGGSCNNREYHRGYEDGRKDYY